MLGEGHATYLRSRAYTAATHLSLPTGQESKQCHEPKHWAAKPLHPTFPPLATAFVHTYKPTESGWVVVFCATPR